MKKLVLTVTVILLCVVLIAACRTKPPPQNQFSDDWTGLFIAVTKNFGENTYYLGSDDTWSYFKSGLISPQYRKVKTSSMALTNIFPYLQSKPYKLELSGFKCSTNANGIVGCGP